MHVWGTSTTFPGPFDQFWAQFVVKNKYVASKVFWDESGCCRDTLLVRKAWSAEQVHDGTFAAASKELLSLLGLPEIFEVDG